MVYTCVWVKAVVEAVHMRKKTVSLALQRGVSGGRACKEHSVQAGPRVSCKNYIMNAQELQRVK